MIIQGAVFYFIAPVACSWALKYKTDSRSKISGMTRIGLMVMNRFVIQFEDWLETSFN